MIGLGDYYIYNFIKMTLITLRVSCTAWSGPYESVQRTFFTYALFQSPTRCVAAHLESYLLHVYYMSELDNLHDDKEINQLELDWITWHRDNALNNTWHDSRTSILQAMQCHFLTYMTNK